MPGGISLDISRWQRTARKYQTAQKQVLTAATQYTQEAMDDGITTAQENIMTKVYAAYTPKYYKRTMTLLRSPQKRATSTPGAVASGSIYISRGVLNENTTGNPKKKPYDWFVERGTIMPWRWGSVYDYMVNAGLGFGPDGHQPRLFWAATILDMRDKLVDEYGPQAMDRMTKYFAAS